MANEIKSANGTKCRGAGTTLRLWNRSGEISDANSDVIRYTFVTNWDIAEYHRDRSQAALSFRQFAELIANGENDADAMTRSLTVSETKDALEFSFDYHDSARLSGSGRILDDEYAVEIV